MTPASNSRFYEDDDRFEKMFEPEFIRGLREAVRREDERLKLVAGARLEGVGEVVDWNEVFRRGEEEVGRGAR